MINCDGKEDVSIILRQWVDMLNAQKREAQERREQERDTGKSSAEASPSPEGNQDAVRR
jgi:hypothetical protein